MKESLSVDADAKKAEGASIEIVVADIVACLSTEENMCRVGIL